MAALPRATPSAQGVDARGIDAFLDAAAGLELHGLLVYRGGAVVAEGFWAPYAAARPHMLHSAVKSWTGTAVGLAIGDGTVSLDDTVLGFFPEHRPAAVSDNLVAMTVRDLLTMRSGHRTGLSGGAWRGETGSWVAAFLREPVVEPPGDAFIYSSGSSYMLSAIVTKATGQTVQALLDERVFRPLGTAPVAWDLSPEGYSTGGNGLSCPLEDVLKFGVLHLQDGVWEGRRLLPEGWCAAATRNQVREAWIAPTDGRTYAARDTPAGGVERRAGYGYQWWMMEGGGYRASGMFGQHCIVLPHLDAVIAVTAALRPGDARLLPLIAAHLVPALAGPGDPGADAALAARLRALALPWPAGQPHSPAEPRGGSGIFRMAANEDGVETVAFRFQDGACIFTLRDGRGVHEVVAGLERPVEGDTTMTGFRLHHQYQPERMRIVAAGTWLDPRRFCMTWRFVETAFCDTVTCVFEGEALRLSRRVNTNAGSLERPMLTGTMVLETMR